MGLGFSSRLWHHVEPALAGHFRVIAFDNRGIGKSEGPPGPQLIPDMADDAMAVLDAAGADTAFVFGLSMGGFIAQEIALRYPRRVRALVLGATTCGGAHAVSAGQEVQDTLVARVRLPPEQSIRVMFPHIYDVSTPKARIEADLALRLADYPDPEIYLGQLEGIQMWQGCDRLHEIAVPTLIMHGENDKLVPPANAHLLAEHIAGSRLCMIPGASHVFTTDVPDTAVRLIVDFVREQTQ